MTSILLLAAFEKTIYIIKKELIFIPIYGWYAIRLGNIFIDCIVTTETGRKLATMQASHQFKLYTGLKFPY